MNKLIKRWLKNLSLVLMTILGMFIILIIMHYFDLLYVLEPLVYLSTNKLFLISSVIIGSGCILYLNNLETQMEDKKYKKILEASKC